MISATTVLAAGHLTDDRSGRRQHRWRKAIWTTIQHHVRLTFPHQLDRRQAEDVRRYGVEQWNYRWSGDYGSLRWSATHPGQVGQDRVAVKAAKLLADGKSVFLNLGDVKPVMQMQVRYGLSTAAGEPLAGVVYHTIHRPAKAAVGGTP